MTEAQPVTTQTPLLSEEQIAAKKRFFKEELAKPSGHSFIGNHGAEIVERILRSLVAEPQPKPLLQWDGFLPAWLMGNQPIDDMVFYEEYFSFDDCSPVGEPNATAVRVTVTDIPSEPTNEPT